MSRLLQLRDAIVSQIADATKLKDVKGHYGRFTDQQLEAFLVAAPAARVAVLALERPQESPDDGTDWIARIGIYIATKDTSAVGNRDAIAVAAVEGVLLLCDRNRWGLGTYCKPCEPKGAQNLYSEKGMKDGVALWAIDVHQPIRIAQPDPAAPGALSALFLGLSPDIGPANVADYTEIAGGAA